MQLQHLDFELSEGTDGVSTLDALASSTDAAQHAAALAEAQAVLGWCVAQFAHGQGPVEEGHDWDHALHVTQEDGGWLTVSLTLSGSDRFVAAFTRRWGTPCA